MLGKRVRDLRETKGLTQLELARMLNVSIRSVGNWERDEKPPSLDSLVEMARVFGVSTDYIVGLTDDPTPNSHNADLSLQESRVVAAIRRGDQLDAIKAIVDEPATA